MWYSTPAVLNLAAKYCRTKGHLPPESQADDSDIMTAVEIEGVIRET